MASDEETVDPRSDPEYRDQDVTTAPGTQAGPSDPIRTMDALDSLGKGLDELGKAIDDLDQRLQIFLHPAKERPELGREGGQPSVQASQVVSRIVASAGQVARLRSTVDSLSSRIR